MLTFVLSVLFNYRSYLRAKVLGVFQINFPKKVYFLFEFSHSFLPHPLDPWQQPINVKEMLKSSEGSINQLKLLKSKSIWRIYPNLNGLDIKSLDAFINLE